jgi:hypothetical protein
VHNKELCVNVQVDQLLKLREVLVPDSEADVSAITIWPWDIM